MDKDIIELFITCIHHKDVENKDDLLKEVRRDGITKHTLKRVGVIFEPRDMIVLKNSIREWKPPQTILYAGGTNRSDPESREKEHLRRFKDMTSFFYCRVEDVKTDETTLLKLGGKNTLKYNKQFSSNCDPKPGYVYVLDTGLTD